MNKSVPVVCLLPLLSLCAAWPSPTHAADPYSLRAAMPIRPASNPDAPYLPLPERAKEFLDPVELLLKSAPRSAVEKLKDDPMSEEAMAELNQYFGAYAINKSIVLHTTIEAAEEQPNHRNGIRIRAASAPLTWDGGSMQRLSWLYFQPADGAKANSVKVGSEITVTGWVRRCEVVRTPDGLRVNFDLQYTRIEDSSKPMATAAE